MSDHPDDRGGPLTNLLRRISQLPPLAAFLGALALGLVAFLTPGPIGAVLVGLFALALGALLAATWERRTPTERAIRLMVLAVLVVIAVVKFGN